MLRQPALAAIWAYQRFVSPRKGFGCAYRLAHGGTGCSGFAKNAIAELGIWRALPAIRRRFAACKVAARTLGDTGAHKGKKKKSRWFDRADCLLACSPCGGGGKSKVGDGGSDCSPDCAPDCCSL